MATRRRRMKSSWIGIGFSHHSVPSLSNTATRSSGGSPVAGSVTRSTKASTASLVGPGVHSDSGSLIVVSGQVQGPGQRHAGPVGEVLVRRRLEHGEVGA